MYQQCTHVYLYGNTIITPSLCHIHVNTCINSVPTYISMAHHYHAFTLPYSCRHMYQLCTHVYLHGNTIITPSLCHIHVNTCINSVPTYISMAHHYHAFTLPYSCRHMYQLCTHVYLHGNTIITPSLCHIHVNTCNSSVPTYFSMA